MRFSRGRRRRAVRRFVRLTIRRAAGVLVVAAFARDAVATAWGACDSGAAIPAMANMAGMDATVGPDAMPGMDAMTGMRGAGESSQAPHPPPPPQQAPHPQAPSGCDHGPAPAACGAGVGCTPVAPAHVVRAEAAAHSAPGVFPSARRVALAVAYPPDPPPPR